MVAPAPDRAARPGVTDAVDGGGAHVVNRFRRKRFAMFRDVLASLPTGRTIRVLDLGGARNYWEGLRPLWSDLPLEITIVNIGAQPFQDGPYRILDGDACALDDHPDMSFDVVHSNSVIEHVGHWPEMQAMAREVRRLAPRYYVQTPNFHFPIEPHFLAPFFHWYPEATRARLLTRRRRGHIDRQATFGDAMLEVQAINLLTARQMAELFPDARVRKERFLGLAKSLIAVR